MTHSSGVSVCLTDTHPLKHSVTCLLMGKRSIGAQEAGIHLTLHFFHGTRDRAVIPASDVLMKKLQGRFWSPVAVIYFARCATTPLRKPYVSLALYQEIKPFHFFFP